MKARIALLAATFAVLSGCGTVEGLGRDVSAAARTVEGWL